jgi:diguanylate cyclase (GGDEF)-like protein/PAS domain S-box-containing protein
MGERTTTTGRKSPARLAPGRPAGIRAPRNGTGPGPEPSAVAANPKLEVARREAILALNQEALQGLTADELIARTIELAIAELDFDYCQLWELLPGEEQLLLRAGSGWGNAASETFTIPVDASLQPGFTLAEGALVVVEDFSQETRFAPPPPFDCGGVTSGISVPIPGPAPGFGVLAGHSARRLLVEPEDLRFMETLGHMLGAAMARQRSLEQLQETERKYRRLIERLPVVTYLAEYGPEGRWIYVSPQIESMLGYTPDEWMGDTDLWLSCVHPDDREMVVAEEARCSAGAKPLALEYRMLARDGRLVWIRDDAAIGTPVDGQPFAVEGLLTDITDAKIAEEQLRHRAEHDDLTGLYNRRRFEDELASFRSRPGVVGAVGLIDVDSLKFVNDSLGHAAGDALLRGISASLVAERQGDEILARFGGDEFGLFLPGVGEEEARERASAYVRAVRTRNSRLPATASSGMVAFDDSNASTDTDLLIAADIALHEAKEHGGDRVTIFTGPERERLAWVGRVRSAIDDGRLLLHAQPIFDLDGGEVVAEELLVRMLGVDGQVLAPSAFLPTAERFGLIREIDGWVIERAVEIAASGSPVTVNISARSIADAELTEMIARRIEETGADPSRIVFEITETGAVTAIEELRDFGMRIERLGCALAVDDFGTGFGSLTYLKHLPVRYLKIDMEFVRGIVGSQSDQAIVSAIVTIAKSLGMSTVAEGVEDQATADLLRDLDVDLAQGFHLGRPHPIALPAR